MTGQKKNSGPMKATEFMAQLSMDKNYQRRKAENDAEAADQAKLLRAAEQPILVALRRVGVEVDSVWDLVNSPDPYPAALPVLIDQLEQGGYPDRIMEGLGRALAVTPAVAYWDRLRALYLSPRSIGEENGLAVALAACATEAHLNDLISFLSLTDRGESRIYFIRPIINVGSRRSLEIINSLKADPTFGNEVRALLKS